MASITNFTGFETGDFSECLFVSGTVSIQSSIKRTGNYAARVNPNGTNDGSFSLGGYSSDGTHTTFSLSTTYIKFYFRYTTKPNSSYEPIFELFGGSDVKILLGLQSDGSIIVNDFLGATLGTTRILSANTWYRIEVKCGTGTNAAYAVLIDGVTELSGTSDLSSTNGEAVYFGKVNNVNGNSVDLYYDDISIASDNFPGPSETRLLKPNANGTFTAWTGDYTSVDEIPHDSDTTTVTSVTNTAVESANVESCSDVGITADGINAVKSFIVARRSGLVVSAKVRLRSSSTNDDTAGVDLDTVYNHYGKVYNNNPSGSVPWLRSSVDSVEVGIVHNQAESREALCTSMGVMVDSVSYVTGTISATSTETISIKAIKNAIGIANITSTATVTVGTNNFYNTAKTLSENTSLAIEADNIITGLINLSSQVLLSPVGLISVTAEISLETVTNLTTNTQNTVNGQIVLSSVVTVGALSLAEVETNLIADTSLSISASNDIIGEITADDQAAILAEANLVVNTANINVSETRLNATASIGILAERVGNGACTANATATLYCQAVKVTGNTINFNAITTLLTETKNNLVNRVSKSATATMTVNSKNENTGSVNLSTSAVTNIFGSRFLNGSITPNVAVSLSARGGFDVLGRASLLSSANISVNLLTKIGVLQYVERTVYISKVFAKSLKIGVKSG